MLRLVVKNSFV